MSSYEFMFKWMKQATKEERHIEEMESFAKKHPIIFMKFHRLSSEIVKNDETSQAYIKAKEQLNKLFTEHEEQFEPVFTVVKKKFS